MRIEFTLRGLPGSVDITLEPNLDPVALGCAPHAQGFPVCTAAIEYEGRGYAAALGWIQVVRSTDGLSEGRGFDLDPYEPLGRLPHPYCWFGFAPVLFDAPSRSTRDPLDWTAHSFLSFIGAEREARALLGFSWGFAVENEVVSIGEPAALPAHAWDEHLPLLRREHPTWTFAPGYLDR